MGDLELDVGLIRLLTFLEMGLVYSHLITQSLLSGLQVHFMYLRSWHYRLLVLLEYLLGTN